MKIIDRELLSLIVVTDPQKERWEIGRNTKLFPQGCFEKEVLDAQMSGKEIKYYYKNLTTPGKVIPIRLIITEIPPGHIQPFRINEVVEIDIVIRGIILIVDSPSLTENNKKKILKKGRLLKEGSSIIIEPKIRYTIMNPGHRYAVVYSFQIPNFPSIFFPGD